MPFSIDEFKSRTATGFSRDSFFLVQFVPPHFYGTDTSFVSYLCSSAQLPGVALLANAQTRWGYGPSKKVPFGMVHSDVNLTLYSDGEGLGIDLFDQWQRNIVAYGTEQYAIQGGLMGEVQYPSHYETDLQILYFSETGEELIRYVMTDAYPLGMGEIPVDWSGQAGIARITVPFTYRTYYIQRFPVTADGGPAFGSDYLDSMYAGPNGMFLSANMARLNALFNAQAFGGGFISMGGTNVSFSAALSLITNPVSAIGSKLNIVGGINASIQSISGGIGLSLSI